MRFLFIDSEKNNHSVSLLCDVMKVSRSGYYAWRTRKPSERALQDEELKTIIIDIFTKNRCVYGVKNILEGLRRKNIHISKRRCSRLMKAIGIRGISKRKKNPRTTVTNPNDRHADDLVRRDFSASAPNILW